MPTGNQWFALKAGVLRHGHAPGSLGKQLKTLTSGPELSGVGTGLGGDTV